jgi:S-adenosylmethionine uptake transporter
MRINRIWIKANNNLIAGMLATCTFLLWTLSDTCFKAVSADIPTGQSVVIVSIASVLVIVVFVLCTKNTHKLKVDTKSIKILLFLGILQFVDMVTWFWAIPLLPLANMYVICFLSPMIIAVLASIFLKEELGIIRILIIAAGFAGVVIAINPTGIISGKYPLLGYIWAFASVLMTAIQMLIVKKSHESAEALSVWQRAIMLVPALFLTFPTQYIVLSNKDLLALVGVGVLFGIGWKLLVDAYKHANATFVAPYQYTRLLFGGVIGYILWQEAITTRFIVGSVIIIAAGVYLMRLEKKRMKVLFFYSLLISLHYMLIILRAGLACVRSIHIIYSYRRMAPQCARTFL